MKSNYFDIIPDEYLILMAQQYWSKLEQFCILLTLDIETEKEKCKNYQIELQTAKNIVDNVEKEL